MHRPDQSIERLCLFLRVKVLFKPGVRFAAFFFSIEEALDRVIHFLKRVAGVDAPIRHSTLLQDSLNRSVGKNKCKDWASKPQVFKQLSGNQDSGMGLD